MPYDVKLVCVQWSSMEMPPRTTYFIQYFFRTTNKQTTTEKLEENSLPRTNTVGEGSTVLPSRQSANTSVPIFFFFEANFVSIMTDSQKTATTAVGMIPSFIRLCGQVAPGASVGLYLAVSVHLLALFV